MSWATKPQFTLLSEMVRDRATAYGEKAALRFLDRETSYAQLHERTLRVAGALLGAGVNAGDRVAYLAHNSSEYYEILLGAASMGAVLVPINSRLADPEIAVILR